MALSCAVRNILIDTGVVTTTYSITGLPFQPKALKCFWMGQDSAVDAISATHDIKSGVGFATSPTDRRCLATQQEDGSDNTECDSYLHNAAVIVMLDNTGAVSGAADLQSMDSDGVTFVIDDQFPTALRVTVIMWGGDDIVSYTTFEFQGPAGTGDFDITSIGFQPDIVWFANGATLLAPPDTRVHASFSIGVAVSTTEQAVLATTALDNAATTDSSRYSFYGSECVAVVSASSGINRYAFVSFLSNGVRLNALEAISQVYVIGLAIKGGSWAVKETLTQTDTSTVSSISGLSFTPKGGFLFSHGTTESTQDTVQTHMQACLGAFESTTVRASQMSSSRDGVGAGTDAVVAIEYDACLVIEDATSAGANLRALMDVNAMQADGVDFIMDDADSAQTFVGVVLWGDSPAASGNLPLLQAIGEA